MENDKIQILLQENQNIRAESGVISNVLHGCAVAFIGSFAALIAAISSYSAIIPTLDKNQIEVIAFGISQIEFFTVMYALQLTADIVSKSAYISYLENRLNQEKKDRLIFWEHLVSRRNHSKGALLFSEIILGVLYFSVFGYCMSWGINAETSNWYFWIQSCEVLAVIAVIIVVVTDGKKVDKLIKEYLEGKV